MRRGNASPALCGTSARPRGWSSSPISRAANIPTGRVPWAATQSRSWPLSAICSRLLDPYRQLDMPMGSQALADNVVPVYLCARKILVVDDEPLIADLLADLLTLHGHIVQKSYSGAAALLIARTFRPDVLISDVTMPGIDGVETASRVRGYSPQCRVLLITPEFAAASFLLLNHPSPRPLAVLPNPVHSHPCLHTIPAPPPPN